MNTASFSIPMSGSDNNAGPPARTRATMRLVIRRDDHIGDSLGFIFLDAGNDQDAIVERLREYLGKRVRIMKAEVGSERIELEVVARRMEEEGARLAEAADALRRQGATRNALALFKESLELDPLSVAALRGMAALLARREDYAGAFRMLCRARETGGDQADLLHELGQAAARMERVAAAVAYLERACELAPDNLAIRQTLAGMGRKPRATRQLKARAATHRIAKKEPGL